MKWVKVISPKLGVFGGFSQYVSISRPKELNIHLIPRREGEGVAKGQALESVLPPGRLQLQAGELGLTSLSLGLLICKMGTGNEPASHSCKT